MTNGEKLKNMTNEELGTWLAEHFNCGLCPVFSTCKQDGKCYDNVANWLGNEAAEEACEWENINNMFIKNPHTNRYFPNDNAMKNNYCNTCGKKIKIVERGAE